MSTVSIPRRADDDAELGLVRILPIGVIKPSPENDIYRPVSRDDLEIIALAESIKQYGLCEPIVLTLDDYILSGHRRYVACQLAGEETVRCRREEVFREGNPDFLALLRKYNRQRVKTRDEVLREEVVSADPEEAHRVLTEYRQEASRVRVQPMELRGVKHRAKITPAKQPFLDAIEKIIARLEDFWPLSVRQIHYQLLNNPPLKHASKPDSRYVNDPDSYKSLSELLTRARYEGLIDFEVIHDPTRPVTTWNVWPNVAAFYRHKMDRLLKGYYRNLLQSQPNHVEIMAEKNTLEGIIRPVAMEYCAPLTIGRGFCSTPPKRAIAKRYEASGKAKLVILIVTDFDPDGEVIAESFARSMRDDFSIENVHAIKVAVTHDQIKEHKLPVSLNAAKPESPNYAKFVAKYGKAAYEVEALPPETLQKVLREAIDSVIDVAAFNAEVQAEKQDAAHLDVTRQKLLRYLRLCEGDGENLN